MPQLKEIATAIGIELPPRTRAAVFINRILVAVGRADEVEDDAGALSDFDALLLERMEGHQSE